MSAIMTLQGPSFGRARPQTTQLLGVTDTIAAHPIISLIGILGTAYVGYRALAHVRSGTISGLAGSISRDAKDCISDEIARHCRGKRGRCKDPRERKQAIAIGFSVCKGKGFRSIPEAR
jgi:hypothetical protein